MADNETGKEDNSGELEARDIEEFDDSKSAPEDRGENGPFDVSEVPAMRPYIDFGGIKVAPREKLQVRLEIEEKAKRVLAITLEYEDTMLQVQAFAAPKSSGLWNGVRGEITQQLHAQKAQVREIDGPIGPEIEAVTDSDKERGSRTVRFLGVDGPRWLLRGVVMGRATEDSLAHEKIVELFRSLVVVRGDKPMPPSEMLPLHVPAGMTQGSTNGRGGETQNV